MSFDIGDYGVNVVDGNLIYVGEGRACHNYGSSALAHGRCVAQDGAQTVSGDAFKTLRNSSLGVAYPTLTNLTANLGGILGILDAKFKAEGKSQLAAGRGNAAVLCYGQGEAYVYVPATTALPIGTPLVLGTEIDTTIKAQKTVSTTAYAGVLEPVVINSAVVTRLPHPVAIVGETVASGDERVALVKVFACRREIGPQPFDSGFVRCTGSATASAVTNNPLLRMLQPGVITGLEINLLTAQGGGDVTLDLERIVVGAPPAPTSLLATTGLLDLTSIGLGYSGLLCGSDGDTDSFDWGTAGVVPVLEAATACVARPGELIALQQTNDGSVSTTAPIMDVRVQGLYF